MPTLQKYPSNVTDIPSVLAWIAAVSRLRNSQDVSFFNNLNSVFMAGRKVGTIPTSATTAATDRVGDYNSDETNFYLCVDNSGTAEWRKVAWTAW